MQTVGYNEQSRFTELNLFSLSSYIGKFECHFLSWGYIEPRWWRNYLHIHSFFEVCYAFQGKGIFRVEEETFTVQAGQIFLARPGEAHEIISSEDDPLGIYFWCYTLAPTSQAADALAESDQLFTRFLQTRSHCSERVPGMAGTIDLLLEEIARREAGCEKIIQALVLKLLLDIARALTPLSPASQPRLPRAKNAEELVVQIMLRYLHDNYSRPLSVRDIAAEVHLSERHASRLFQRSMHTSLMDYLTRFRLEHAAQLLIETHQSIKEVAQCCGYPDVRHFTTLFRRHYQVTPAVFRTCSGTRFLPSTPEVVHIHG